METVALSPPTRRQTEPAACGLQDDLVYRATTALREPGRLLALMRAAWPQGKILHAEVRQTAFNPGSRARLVGELLLEGDAGPHFLSLKVFETPERAAEAHANELKKKILSARGPALMLLDDGHTVAWWVPNGQNLKKARVCFNHEKFTDFAVGLNLLEPGAAFTLPQMLRYVPRRRALFRWSLPDGRTTYLKFYQGDDHQRAACNLSALNEMGEMRPGLGFRTPSLLAYSEKRGAIVMGEVPGLVLTGLLPAAEPEVFNAIGHALAQLHASPMRPVVQHTAELELQALAAGMIEVKSAVPSQTGRVDMLMVRLVRAARPCPYPGPVHGNLFGDQILVANDGIGIVDWDDLSLGDPLYDIGRLIAHLIYLSLCGQVGPLRTRQYMKALLSTYAMDCQAIDDGRLRWQVAVALLLRAKISALRPLAPDWDVKIGATVVAAQQVLDGAWLP